MTDMRSRAQVIAAGLCWHDPETRIGCGEDAKVETMAIGTAWEYKRTGWCADCQQAAVEMGT